MTEFSDLQLHPALYKALDALDYKRPTPIQASAIPFLLNGHDLTGIAQTGTGKTAAFVLPILNHVYAELDQPQAPKRRPKSMRALILVPTRELAAQVAQSVKTYSSARKASHVVIMGGVKAGPQIRALNNGVDIGIATPGRLLDLVSIKAVDLNSCGLVVLDEADQMLDMGFIPAIRRIMDLLPKDRQTVLFSATMPKQIRSLADDFLSKPKRVAVTPESKPVERIDQRVVHVEKSEKRKLLANLLDELKPERTIIFVRTKRGADSMERFLAKSGHVVGALHGDKSQGQRTNVMRAFREGSLNMLIATDIAARGIDVDDVSHVFNYELPNVPEAYVHRIGRTARAGKEGRAIAFCAPDERPLLRDIERTIKMQIERLPAPGEAEGFEPSLDLEDLAFETDSGKSKQKDTKAKKPHRKGQNRSERSFKQDRDPKHRNRRGKPNTASESKRSKAVRSDETDTRPSKKPFKRNKNKTEWQPALAYEGQSVPEQTGQKSKTKPKNSNRSGDGNVRRGTTRKEERDETRDKRSGPKLRQQEQDRKTEKRSERKPEKRGPERGDKDLSEQKSANRRRKDAPKNKPKQRSKRDGSAALRRPAAPKAEA